MQISKQLEKFDTLNLKFEYLSLINKPNKSNLSFIDSKKYDYFLKDDFCFAYVLIEKALYAQIKDKFRQNFIVTESPRLIYFSILDKINKKINQNQFSKDNIIHDTAVVLSNIPDNSDICIGANTRVEKNTIILPGTHIGDNCVISSFCILGEQGYEVKRNDKSSIRIEHAGKVVIGDNVDIKSFTSIHRAVYLNESTSIGSYTKIDSHVHIGHGNIIGENNLICSHANISGNSIIKDKTYIGPGANIPNRLIIESNSKVLVGSTITQNVPKNVSVSGNFAIEHDRHINFIKDLANND